MVFNPEQNISKSYAEYSPGQLAVVQARYKAAKSFASEILGISSTNRWLDIGPNKSSGPKILSELGSRLTCIDIKRDFLKETSQLENKIDVTQMDGTKLGFPNSTFKIVTALEVVEHIEPENQKEFFQETVRVLKPNGLFIVSTPNKIASGRRTMSPDHKKELTPEELISILSELNLNIIENLGQWFFNQSILHKSFRSIRQNPLAVFINYHLIPWSLRSKIRDVTLPNESAAKVRKGKNNEIPRIKFLVCQKK